MVDVTTPEDQRLGIRAEHDVGLDCSHDRHESTPQPWVVLDLPVGDPQQLL